MKRKSEQANDKNRIDDKGKHQQATDGDNEIDPMGTEVMQEDEYQRDKHGEFPEEKQRKNSKK